MAARTFDVFPNSAVDRGDMCSQTTHIQTLFCTCSVPEDGIYFECIECELWFHPNCEGMGDTTIDEINNMKNAKCLDCQSKKVKKSRNKRK